MSRYCIWTSSEKSLASYIYSSHSSSAGGTSVAVKLTVPACIMIVERIKLHMFTLSL